MVSFSLHMTSLLIGIVIGILISSFCFFLVSLGKTWETGFGEGWNCGCKYANEKNKEET